MNAPHASSLHLRRFAWLLAALPLLASAGEPGAFTRVGEAETVFDAVGPAGFKMQGKTSALILRQEGGQLTLVVPLAGLETGIALRDRHLREKYLEVAKYPEAQLQVELTKLKLPEPGAKSAGEAEGTLQLHGVSRKVSFRYEISRQGETYSVVGTVPLNMSHYQIQKPSYLGVTVKPDVVVTSRFGLRRQ